MISGVHELAVLTSNDQNTEAKTATDVANVVDWNQVRGKLRKVFGRGGNLADIPLLELDNLRKECEDVELDPRSILLLGFARNKALSPDFLRRRCQLRPTDFWSHLVLGIVLLRQNHIANDKATLEEAIGCARTAVALEPNSAIAYLILGIGSGGKGNNENSRQMLTKAVRCDPEFYLPHLFLAAVLAGENHLTAALTAAKESARLAPESSECQRLLSSIYCELQKFKAAIEHAKRAIELNSENSSAHAILGQALISTDKRGEALKVLQRGVDLDPKNDLALNNLGWAHTLNGDLEAAIPILQRAIKANPNNPKAHINLGRAYNEAGDYGKAISVLERGVVLAPNYIHGHNYLTFAYNYSGDFKNGLVHALRAIRIDPKNVIAHNNVAFTYHKLGDFQKANEYFNKAIALDPTYINAQANKALLLLDEKKFKAAEAILAKCLLVRKQTQPGNWMTFRTQAMLGKAILGQERYGDAEPYLLEGYRGMKERANKLPPIYRVNVEETLGQIIDLYNRWDKTDEAAKWRAIREQQSPPKGGP